MRFILSVLVVCLLAGSFQSCVSKKKYDELTAAKAATDAALAQTQTQVKELETKNQELETKYDNETKRLTTEIEGVRTEMNQKMTAVNQELAMTKEELNTMKKDIGDMFDAYGAADLAIEERDGDLYVTTASPLTYATGSTQLSREERDAIDALAEKMKGNEKLRIVVEGHADNQKYPARSGYDNWDLSYARAKSVASRLIRQGVDPSQVALMGRGDTVPTADNSTREGRAENRRTVIKPHAPMGGFMKKN